MLIDEPVGIYYGGTIAAPVIASLFDNILPYMGIEANYSEEDLKNYQVGQFQVPNFIGKTRKEMKDLLKIYEFGDVYISGEGDTVTEQFPLPGDSVNRKADWFYIINIVIFKVIKYNSLGSILHKN